MAVGTLSTAGRWRDVGRKVEFQTQLSATTSIAVTSGTHFISLPNDAAGLAGLAVMTNTSSKTSALATVEVSTSRVYLPTQAASAAVFTVCGWYEPKG